MIGQSVFGSHRVQCAAGPEAAVDPVLELQLPPAQSDEDEGVAEVVVLVGEEGRGGKKDSQRPRNQEQSAPHPRILTCSREIDSPPFDGIELLRLRARSSLARA